MALDPRIATTLGRSTSGFHRPGRRCAHQARSAVRCRASRLRGGSCLLRRTACEAEIFAYGGQSNNWSVFWRGYFQRQQRVGLYLRTCSLRGHVEQVDAARPGAVEYPPDRSRKGRSTPLGRPGTPLSRPSAAFCNTIWIYRDHLSRGAGGGESVVRVLTGSVGRADQRGHRARPALGGGPTRAGGEPP